MRPSAPRDSPGRAPGGSGEDRPRRPRAAESPDLYMIARRDLAGVVEQERNTPLFDLLEARDIVVTFGNFRAVDGASLDIRKGEIIGLIGPNGAGKSTFFNCLAGDRQPAAGSIRLGGHNVTRASPEEHARLGLARSWQVPAMFVLESCRLWMHVRTSAARTRVAELRSPVSIIFRIGVESVISKLRDARVSISENV